MSKKDASSDVSIGKFDILATYTYAHALLSGLDDDEAKQRGMVAAIMGAQARLGIRKEHHEDFQAQKEAAEKKKKTTITAESFDKQVADKIGKFFDEAFLPILKKLVEAGLSYDDVKRLVKIPTTWGAKITGEQFVERASKFDDPNGTQDSRKARRQDRASHRRNHREDGSQEAAAPAIPLHDAPDGESRSRRLRGSRRKQ